MAAGLSKSQIASRIRTRLKKIAAANGGEYVAGSVNRRPCAEGKTPDGLFWEVHFSVGHASNGETCGIPVFDVWSDDVPHSERHTLNGLTGDLQSALETFRAARDQALTYVVLPSQAGGPGDAFDVGPGRHDRRPGTRSLGATANQQPLEPLARAQAGRFAGPTHP